MIKDARAPRRMEILVVCGQDVCCVGGQRLVANISKHCFAEERALDVHTTHPFQTKHVMRTQHHSRTFSHACPACAASPQSNCRFDLVKPNNEAADRSAETVQLPTVQLHVPERHSALQDSECRQLQNRQPLRPTLASS